MIKKTKQLTNGDMVRNILDGNHYPLESVEKSGAGYIVTLIPGHINGNRYYAEYHSHHQIRA